MAAAPMQRLASSSLAAQLWRAPLHSLRLLPRACSSQPEAPGAMAPRTMQTSGRSTGSGGVKKAKATPKPKAVEAPVAVDASDVCIEACKS